jgi:hypothetical protein
MLIPGVHRSARISLNNIRRSSRIRFDQNLDRCSIEAD